VRLRNCSTIWGYTIVNINPFTWKGNYRTIENLDDPVKCPAKICGRNMRRVEPDDEDCITLKKCLSKSSRYYDPRKLLRYKCCQYFILVEHGRFFEDDFWRLMKTSETIFGGLRPVEYKGEIIHVG